MSYRKINEKLKNPREYVISKIEDEFDSYERYLKNQLIPLRQKKADEVRRRLKLPQMETKIDKAIAVLNAMVKQYKNIVGEDVGVVDEHGDVVSFHPAKYVTEDEGYYAHQKSVVTKLTDQELGLTKYGEMLKKIRAKKDQFIEDIMLSKSPDLKAILADLPNKLEEVKKLMPVKAKAIECEASESNG